MTANSFQVFLTFRVGAIIFLLGKVIRFLLFFIFLLVLLSKTKLLSGYNLPQVILFYMTFNFIDSLTQTLFRDVYRFRQYIVSGNFDLLLVKPMSTLFRVLFGGTDLLDCITLLPFIFVIIILMNMMENVTFFEVIAYLVLVINALFIALSFHIIVMALAVVTLEIDNAIMIYRDFTGMGKIPIDIYKEPLRSFVTFVVPVGIMMTFPVKAFLGILDVRFIILSLGFGMLLFITGLYFWNYALRQYTSASS